MGRKILVVTDETSQDFVATMIAQCLAIDSQDFEFFMCSHAGASAMFEKEMPNVAIVCGYMDGSLVKGFQSYNEIRALAKSWQVVARIGPEKHDHPDHIMYPSGEVPMVKSEERFRSALRCLFTA